MFGHDIRSCRRQHGGPRPRSPKSTIQSSAVTTRMMSKTPSHAQSALTKESTSVDRDSHIGRSFHDIVFDAMVHEFDESNENLLDTSTLHNTVHDDEDTKVECRPLKAAQSNSSSSSASSTTRSSITSSKMSKKRSHISCTNLKKTRRRSTSTRTQAQIQTMREFEYYLKFQTLLWIMTLFAIGSYQMAYYRHYYISGIFAWLTCGCYTLLLIPRISRALANDCCSFALVVIRLCHTVAIITLFVGVATCQYQYKTMMAAQQAAMTDQARESDHEIQHQYLSFLERVLYGLLFVAILSCWLQNFYTIKYDEFVVRKWKGIYWCYLEHVIVKDGCWRNEVHPVHSVDRLLSFILLLTTFSAILISVMCINRMELASS